MFDPTEMVKEIQEMREDGYLSDALLRYAVRGIKEGDDRYDWVGVYLVTDDQNELWLHNYVGPKTEHAKIPVGQGVCGSAVAEKSNKIVDDVSQVENYIQDNPSVASEMVVLIRAGDEVFGQFALDSMEPSAFTPEDEQKISLLADKLAEQLMAERR